MLILPEHVELFKQDKVIQSMIPAETLFGFTYWSHMIPPYKPNNILILGYGKGQVVDLIEKIWGFGIVYTGVDYNDDMKNGSIVIEDAKEFIKNYGIENKPKFDYTCIDLWNGKTICEDMFEDEFAINLKKINTNMVCFNTYAFDKIRLIDCYVRNGFIFERSDNVQNNLVSWWSV